MTCMRGTGAKRKSPQPQPQRNKSWTRKLAKFVKHLPHAQLHAQLRAQPHAQPLRQPVRPACRKRKFAALCAKVRGRREVCGTELRRTRNEMLSLTRLSRAVLLAQRESLAVICSLNWRKAGVHLAALKLSQNSRNRR